MDESAAIPYWMAFLVGPILLGFAAWVLPGRLREARTRLQPKDLSGTSPSDVFDAWFPAIWAGGVGAFGGVFVIGGLLRLVGVE